MPVANKRHVVAVVLELGIDGAEGKRHISGPGRTSRLFFALLSAARTLGMDRATRVVS